MISSDIRLPHQSFRVLAMLLERAGQLVTREELRARLWPAGTLVEYDQGLNAAVNRLREAAFAIDSGSHVDYIYLATHPADLLWRDPTAGLTQPAASKVLREIETARSCA